MRRMFALCLFASVTVGAVCTLAGDQQVPPTSGGSRTEMVYIVTGTKATGLYHRKDCPWLRDASMQIFMLHEAKSRYFQPHCLCTTGKEGTPPCEAAVAPPAVEAPVVQPVTTPTPAPALVNAVSPRATPPPVERATTRQQCAATTKKGTRCSRMAQPGRAYCWQHP